MIGTVVNNYTVLQKLGSGGFGTVYKAQHNDLKDLYVAIKFMHKELVLDEAYKAALKQECLVLNQLQHSNIVGFRDLILAHDPPAVFMELLEGSDVSTCMEQRRLSISEVLYIGQECLKALEFAHSKQILHRDIKPENIFLCTDGTVKVADFGIAKRFDQENNGYTETIKGTLNYLAPEVFREQVYSQKTDIYALGLTLWEMLAHKKACENGSMMTKVYWHIQHKIEDIACYALDCPPDLQRIIMDMCQANPDKRSSSASDLLRRWPKPQKEELSSETTVFVQSEALRAAEIATELIKEPVLQEGIPRTSSFLSTHNEKIEKEASRWVLWGIGSVFILFVGIFFFQTSSNTVDERTLLFKNAKAQGIEIAVDLPKSRFVEARAFLVQQQKKQKERKQLAARIGFSFSSIMSKTFTMGCTLEHGRECHTDELPTHERTLPNPFEMMTSEVTESFYHHVTQTKIKTESCGETCPVHGITWMEAIEFANRLNHLLGLEECYVINGEDVYWPKGFACNGWRLPTEIEWEFAARANTDARYSGSKDVDTVAWYKDNSDQKIHPVCSKQSNAFSLCDMSGNVWEWVWDWYGVYNPEENDLKGPINGTYRMVRGGSFAEDKRWVRTVVRQKVDEKSKDWKIGFRLVRSQQIQSFP